MADARVRAAELRWRQSSTLEDELRFRHEQVRAGLAPPSLLQEARYLVAREQTGDLRRGGVSLAAYLGHEEARAALDFKTPRGLKTSRRRLRRWCRRLGSWGKEPALRASLAATRFACPAEWSARGLESPPIQRLIALLDAAEAWLAEPTPERRDASRALCDVPDRWRAPLMNSALATGWIAGLQDPNPDLSAAQRRAIRLDLSEASTIAIVGAGNSLNDPDWEELHRAIQRALLPWLLGPGALA